MKKTIGFFCLIVVLLLSFTGCDIPKVYFDEKKYDISKEGGDMTIETYSTGVNFIEISTSDGGEWIDIYDYGFYRDNPSGSQVQLEALPLDEGYIRLHVFRNDTGKKRVATLYVWSGPRYVPVKIYQDC